jgi:hypothetical protein
VDSGDLALLTLLDLPAAVDTVDHVTLQIQCTPRLVTAPFLSQLSSVEQPSTAGDVIAVAYSLSAAFEDGTLWYLVNIATMCFTRLMSIYAFELVNVTAEVLWKQYCVLFHVFYGFTFYMATLFYSLSH